MALLLDDLLDVSRITRGKLSLRREMIDLSSAIDTALESARPLIEGRRHQHGYQVAQAVREHPWGSTVRLVALSGWGQWEDRERALEAGFDKHVTKPIDPATIRSLLEP